MLRKPAVNVAQSPCPTNARGACVTLAQSRCHELTVTDIYIYIQTHGDSSTVITCLAFRLGNEVVVAVHGGLC